MENVNVFLSEILKKDIRILLDKDGEKIRVVGKVKSLTQKDKEDIAFYKKDLIKILKLKKNTDAFNFGKIENVSPQANYPISDAQRRLWILSQFEEGSVAYNMPDSIFLNEQINIENFKKAVRSTIDRHEILRTVFKADESAEIRQWIQDKEAFDFEITYIDYRTVEDSQQQVAGYIQSDSYAAFDLEKGPLLRASLLQVEDAGYVFYYNMHHIISDGWSMDVLSKDVLAFYAAYQNNQLPEIDELQIQYKDYSAWQLAQLETENFKAHKTYWQHHLSGELPLLDLPGAKQRPRIKTYNGQGATTYLDKEISSKLRSYTQTHGGSTFMAVLACWKVFMYRHTGDQDIIIGTPIAGREHANLEDQIGFYINTLALRNKLNPKENFDVFYQQLKENTLKSYAHQMYPFDRLLEELDLQRDTSRSALFDMSITYHNISKTGENQQLSADFIKAIRPTGPQKAKFDIELHFHEVGDYLSFSLVYNQDLYEAELITSLMSDYQQLLAAVLAQPDLPVSELNYLSDEQREQLLVDFNRTQTAYPSQKSIAELFEDQVSKTPDNIALSFNGNELTYQELDLLSNQFADYLIKNHDIAPGDLIGIQLERSEWLVVSILGVLKAGGAYVPIDPDYPATRKEHISQDTGIKLLVTESAFIYDIDYYQGAVFAVDVEFEAADYSADKLPNSSSSNDLAYIMYTSGSTGKPKGVMVEQKSVIRLVKNSNFYSFSAEDKLLATGAISFDATTFEFWGPLLNGGQLVLCSQGALLDNNLLNTQIKSNGINIMWFTAGWLNQLIESNIEIFSSLTTLLAGGDKLSASHIARLKKAYPQLEIINGYGPTENTTFSITHNITALQGEIPLGKPISNTEVYILNEQNGLQAQGVIGEICLAGDGLARGYLNQPELTKEKFITSPFDPNKRLYKTGDLGRWTRSANIEFIGRKDAQVKVRGYRIELGEIESALLDNPSIEQVVVVAKENENKERDLVAYLTAQTQQNTNELRSYLKETLPAYMLPAYFVQLDQLPLTANGKVDRKALPKPEGLGLISGVEYVAPEDELEKQLVVIWETVLQHEKIGVKDDFFTLGGHSLKAIRLTNEYQKELAVKLSLQDLFANTTIHSHAALIKGATKAVFVQIEQTPQQANYAISDAQRRLWVLSQFEQGSAAYNIPSSVYLNEAINIENFKKAIGATIARHEILRTVFKENEQGEIRQWILNTADLGFEIDYQDLQEQANNGEKVSAYIAKDSFKAFDLENGPLIRATLLQVDKQQYVFYYNVHHIISDGWSREVLSKDIFAYYKSYQTNKKPALEPLRIQYKDYSAWQLAQLEQASFKAHKAYWVNQLEGELPLLDLPSFKTRPKLKTHHGQGLSTYLNKSITQKIKHYSEQHGGSVFMSLLATWNVLMYHYTGQKDIIIGTPTAGREHADLEDQIGFYVNTLALRNKLDSQESFTDFYQRLKQNTLKGYKHQMYPFDRLVEDLDLQRDTSRSAIFDMMLILQNNGERAAQGELSDQYLNQINDHGYMASKFDMSINFEEQGDYISFHLHFNTDVYEKEMAQKLMQHYKQLIAALLEKPEDKIAEITCLLAPEIQELTTAFNDTQIEYPKGKTLVDLFQEQVTKTPNSIALVFKETALSYQELDERSNQLANYLSDNYEICPDDLIGIKLDRSQWMLIAILGVLKSGAAYVPIDPAYPQERIDYIEQDANCKVCLDEDELEKYKANESHYSKEQIQSESQENNLAYVIYTSGSTGKPKGVMVEHKAIVNTLRSQINDLGLSPKNRGLEFASFSFDASIWESFGILLAGACLFMVDDINRQDPDLLKTYIKANAIDIATLSPSYLSKINMDELAGLQTLITAGEAAHYQTAIDFHKTGTYYNAYGPTETSICATVFKLEDSGNPEKPLSHNLPIGKPISNTQIYILNQDHHLVPKGVIGEICIAGAGLARGYLNQEALTQTKFIANPFQENERLYKTGDLGRWLEDGNIEFLGRKDDQVKIRGNRVELGEIEQTLLKVETIDQAVLVVLEKELVAYFTSEKPQNATHLRAALKETLPDYMLPAYYVQLDEIPLTTNAKIDKKALPSPVGLGLDTGVAYVAPTTDLEIQLAGIWAQILHRSDIGIQDDFFVLGGQSLKAVQLSNAYLKAFSVKLSLQDLFENTTIKTHLKLIEVSNTQQFMRIENVSPQASYPISDAQRRLWILSQFEEGSVAYNMPDSIFLNEQINIENFKKAVRSTIDRHEILRTVFKADESAEIRQWIQDKEAFDFEITYIDYRTVEDSQQQVAGYIQSDSYAAFDLEKGPLLRASLLQVEDAGYVFYYNMHHIISDGWSMDVLSKDVLAFYAAYQNNQLPEIDELQIQYKDYSAWQLAQLETENFKAHKTYWQHHLSGELPLLDLPGAKQRPRIKTYNGQGATTYLDKEISSKLRSYTQTHGGSTFMAVLACWKVFMYRHTGDQDIIIGTPIAGREHANLEDQIGFYINTLALRNKLNPKENFDVFYQQLKENTLKSYAHQMYPFDRLLEELDLQRDTSRSALFDMSITYHNISKTGENQQLSADFIKAIRPTGPQKAKFDIELHFHEVGDYLSFSLVYNQDLYEAELITSLMSDYRQLLAAVLAQPDLPVSELNYLSDEQREQLLVDFNRTQTAYPSQKSIAELFEDQVLKTPDNIALSFNGNELTYQELDLLSNQFADYLIKNHDIAPGDLIGIQLERSEWLVVSILGVLKAGGAYVPIDPDYPATRKEHISQDTGIKLLVTESAFIYDIDYYQGAVFAVDVEFEAADYSADKLPNSSSSNDLAYIMYTSGSTGKPKGVMVEQKSVIRLVKNSNFYSFSAEDKLLATGAISFDATTFEFWGPLLNGGQLVLCSQGALLDNNLLNTQIKSNGINIMWFTAGWLNQLIESNIEIFSSLTTLLAGGDKLSASHIARLKKAYPQLEIINGYGPTENTTFSITHNITALQGEIPLGKPISNTEVYILNEQNGLQAQGVIGEICLAGDGLARGYLNQPELTKEKFITSPFDPNKRLYKTGDLGRWTRSANIEFIGRKDAQVKVRGYRIELGEIESALLDNPSIEQVVVVAKENENKERDLVAYLTAQTQQNTNELRSYLKETLPAYMLPAYFVQLDQLPLTANGKVDRKALPKPEGLGLISGVEYVAPEDELEKQLVVIWETVLQHEKIGVKDDFFTLGGHSLKAIRLTNEYQKELAVKLSLQDLFANTTIHSHAALIKGATKAVFVQIEQTPQQANYAISDAQRRLWVLSQFEQGSAAYNIPSSVYLNEAINIENFKKAIGATIARHEILRTVFKENEQGEIRQWILNTADLGFEIDYQDLQEQANNGEKVSAYIAKDSFKAFDLENGPLIRATLLQVDKQQYVFYYNVHHIISDGWSREVLSKDIFAYYKSYQTNKKPALEPLRIQYKDYSAWQLAQLEQASFKAHKAYWVNQLEGELPLLDLPSFKTRPKLKTHHGQGLSTYLNKSITQKIKHYSEQHGGSVFMSLLATWNVLMYHYTGQKDIIIGTPTAGREHADLEDQIGFYVNTLALRNKLDSQESFTDFYQRLKQNTLKGYKHQMYPFDRLVEDLDLQRDTSRSAIFDMMLILQNNGERAAQGELSDQYLNQINDHGYMASKFDMSINFEEQGDYISFHLHFNTDVYEKEMAQKLMQHYKQLIAALLEKPEDKIAEITCLLAPEIQELTTAFNDTQIEYPKGKTLVDLFQEQVTKTPNSIALVFKETALSYQELDERSNQLANYLSDNYEICPDDLIGIKLDRSQWMLIAILGVLKSGAAYVPIDPAYPQERIDYIEQDANCKVCLDEDELEKYKANESHYSKEQIQSESQENNLAYVIYTSGSTGKPKGVMVEHKAIVNTLRSQINDLGLSPKNRGLEFASFSFDASIWESFGILLAGACLFMVDDINRQDPDLLKTYIKANAIDIATLSPSYLSKINMDELAGLQTLITAGEAAHYQTAIDFHKTGTYYNAYGPTETSICATVFKLEDSGNPEKPLSHNLPIGKPISNTQIYILNQDHHLVPKGVIGEICIAGAGLARGYLNQEALTQTKFIANPFQENERLYKTGDLGRWLEDGNIEFLGRKDDQVKIRGNRVELGEIEQTLLKVETIDQAVLVVLEKELVAYFTSEKPQNATHLRAALKETLPDYMLPAYYVQLDEIPLTTNAKIDKKALPSPVGLGLDTGVAYVAPTTDLEIQLAGIWAQILHRSDIGIQDDFFVLGGQSLKAVQLSNAYLKAFSVKLSLQDLFENTTIKTHLKLIEVSNTQQFMRIENVSPQASYPISDAQRRLWILSQFEEGSVAYNMPDSIFLNEQINIENFKKAVRSTIDRHEILRTVFKADESAEIRQWIQDKEAFDFEITYIDYRTVEDSQQQVAGYIQSDSYAAFDLEKGPLLRASLLQVEDAGYVFYYNMHHIISDGWSMDVLSKDVLAFYAAYQNNQLPEIDELQIQYKDYSAWQLAQLETENFKAHKTYWQHHLSGELPLLDLPGAKQRPRIKTYNGEVLHTYLDRETTKRLKTYTASQNGSLFMTLLASWHVLFYRYTAQKEVIIGTPIAGRNHSDLEDQLGMYINTLALKNQVNPLDTFDAFYQNLKDNTLEAYNHQMYPFDRLVEEIKLPQDTSRSAVFDVMLKLQNYGHKNEEQVIDSPDLMSISSIGQGVAKFDLDFTFQEVGDCLSFHTIYNTDLYDKEIVEELIARYKKLVVVLLGSPKKPIVELDLLSKEEKNQLLVTFNNTNADYPNHKTAIDLFEEQVVKTPHKIAIQFEDKVLTYQTLNEQANQLAHYLKEKYQINAEDLIGIQQIRSEWMIISLIATFKLGGVYIPIDPTYPQKRVDFIKEDTNYKICLDEKLLNKFRENQLNYSTAELKTSIKANQLAYIIYTSGSTGEPKGVMLEHRNLVSFISGFNFGNAQRIAGSTNLTFDIAGLEIWGALCYGKELVLMSDNELNDPLLYLEKIEKSVIDAIQLTPSRLALLYAIKPHLPACLSTVIVGGEPLGPFLYDKLKNEPIKSVNAYGPTETTIWSTALEIGESESLSIGKPLKNEQVYILNESGNIQAIEVIGEICIGGSGVGRGYLNQPELTKEKFVSNPFKTDERLYKTGDLGRWLSNGSIEFIGRADDQVKISGHRIELGEIEAALSFNEAINAVVVMAISKQENNNELVAYIRSSKKLNTSDLRTFLAKQLPAYMLPTYFVQLDEFPLLASGKIDKKALPNPQGLELSTSSAYSGPRNDVEAKMATLWESVLQVDKIGIDDDFFELGGNSIKAVHVSRAAELNTTLKTLYQQRTIRKCAEMIKNETENHQLVEAYNIDSNFELNIILIPYAGATDIAYQKLAKKLAAHYNVYIVSMPWHTLKDDVVYENHQWIERELIKEIKLKISGETVILGHSAGTSLALLLSYQLMQLKFPLIGLFQCAQQYNKNYVADLENGGWSNYTDDEIWDNVISTMGFDQQRLNKKTKTLIIANLRHDTQIAEHIITEIQANKGKLNIPIHTLFGELDPLTKNFETEYKEWGMFTNEVTFGMIKNAGHYFVNQHIVETVFEITKKTNEWTETNNS